eukprot:gene9775-9932_t
MAAAVHMKQQMRQVLQSYWGYPAFREPQEAVINNALTGGDGLVVMATGGGKSLCYQVPPLVNDTICIVVSPLIALMEDQVAALTARGIRAAMLGSAQTSAEVKRRAWAGEYQLIYITPELAATNITGLQQLHSTSRIGLIAVDEAHCVSEWGHDFRPSFRQLGQLRKALPDVPLMAVTATATDRVRKDIITQLGMGSTGGPTLRQWVMSFQRTNLHLSVIMKNGTGAASNLAALVRECQEHQGRGQQLEPTLIYAQTTKEVDELCAHLQSKGVPAVKYHAKLSVAERSTAHRAFQRDDAAVMVASLAFGMGIDKPNIRRIIHFGIPSSLEAYYQQAGRAGRDGLPARCCLMWTPQDFNVQDLIKGASQLSGWNLDSHMRGMAALRAYTCSGECRHACLVNFFQPNALSAEGPCVAGCDNCTRSKAKGVEHWMQQLPGPGGTLLHGAGSSRSEEWWKGLAGVLLGQGYIQSQSKTNPAGASYSVYVVTAKGQQLLSQPLQPLPVLLPVHMDREETRQRQREAAEQQRAAARVAVQQQRDEVAAETQALLQRLKEARKATADVLQQAPDVLVNDFTLNQLLELRPATIDELQLVSGFGQEALKHFSQPLLQGARCFADDALYQQLLDAQVLSQPKGAAAAALDRWELGETAEMIASNRDKAIQVGTVLGYLADTLAAAGALPTGCRQQQLLQLQQEAGLAGSSSAEALMWRIVAGISSHRAAALGALKRVMPEEVSYGQIKVVAALMALQAVPGLSPDSSAQQQQQPGTACDEEDDVDLPCVPVQRNPALERLLQLPGATARSLHARWRAGVPLTVLGTLDGLNMQAETTAYERTLETLRGVLTGLYPAGNTSAAVPQVAGPLLNTGAAATAVQVLPVGTRWPQDDILIANNLTCPALPQLVAPFQAEQQRRTAADSYTQQLMQLISSAFHFSPGLPFLWNRLRDSLACMAADGKDIPHTKSARRYFRVLDYTATQRKLQLAAPAGGNCLGDKEDWAPVTVQQQSKPSEGY